MTVLVQLWLPLLLCCAATLALPLPEEHDSEESRKVLGSSVVTSVSVVMDNENVKTAYFADAAGKPMEQPKEGGEIGSPVDLVSPDRFQFFTFDESGNLITRYMTRDEVKSIIANGQKSTEMQQESPTFYHNLPASGDDLVLTPTEDEAVDSFSQTQTNMHSVVASVQNVLKGHLEESLLDHPEPTATIPSTPDTASSWSLILPSYLGNNVAEDKTETSSSTMSDAPVSSSSDKKKPDKLSEMASSESLLMADAPAETSENTEENTSSSESEEMSSETSETEENVKLLATTTMPPITSSGASTKVSSIETSIPTKSTEVRNKTNIVHHSQSSESSDDGSGELPMLLIPLDDIPVNPTLTSSQEANLHHLVETISPEVMHTTITNKHSSTEEESSEESEETHSSETTLTSVSTKLPASVISTSTSSAEKSTLSPSEEDSTIVSHELTSPDSSLMGDAPNQHVIVDKEVSNGSQSNEDTLPPIKNIEHAADSLNTASKEHTKTDPSTKLPPSLSEVIRHKTKDQESMESLAGSNEYQDDFTSLSMQTEENVSTSDTDTTTTSTKETTQAVNKGKFPIAVSESTFSEENSSSTSSDHIITLHKENHDESKEADSSNVENSNHTIDDVRIVTNDNLPEAVDVNDPSTAVLSVSSSSLVPETLHSKLDESDELTSSETTFMKIDTKSPEQSTSSDSVESDYEDSTTITSSLLNELNVSSDLADAITSILQEVTNEAVLGATDAEVAEHFIKISSITDIPSPGQSTLPEKVTEESSTEEENDKVNVTENTEKPDDVVVVSVSSSQSSQSSTSSVSTETKDEDTEKAPIRHTLKGSEHENNPADHVKRNPVSESENHIGKPETFEKVQVPILLSQKHEEQNLNTTQGGHHKGHNEKIDVGVTEVIKLMENEKNEATQSKPESQISTVIENGQDTIESELPTTEQRPTKENPADEADEDGIVVPSDQEEVAAIESKDPLTVTYKNNLPQKHGVNTGNLADKYLDDATTAIYDLVTLRTTTAASHILGDTIDISEEEVPDIPTKKVVVVETGEGSGEGSGVLTVDDEDTSQGTVSESENTEEGSGAGTSEKFEHTNGNLEETTIGYVHDKNNLHITTLGYASGEEDTTDEPVDSNANKISHEQSSYSGSGDGIDQSNDDVSDSESEQPPSNQINSSSDGTKDVWAYVNGSEDVGIKGSSQNKNSESGNGESIEKHASSASLFDVDDYIKSNKDIGILPSTNTDNSGSVKSSSTERTDSNQSSENIIATSSSKDEDSEFTTTFEVETPAAEYNNSKEQNDANMSPEFDLKTFSGNSESDKTEQSDASLSQSIYDLSHYINSDKDIGIKKTVLSQESDVEKSEQVDASLSQSIYDLEHYLNSDKDIGIKKPLVSEESEPEKSEQNEDKINPENISNINNSKNTDETTHETTTESVEKPETEENNSQDANVEQNINSSSANIVESSESESTETNLQETTTFFDIDQEMNDQQVFESSSSSNEEKIQSTPTDSKPQTNKFKHDETKDENIKYYKTDIHNLNHARPNHESKKPPGNKHASQETSWTKVDVISPEKTSESAAHIHQRTPQIPAGNQLPSHADTSLVELHPAPQESLGLEASTVHLFEDVQKFADLCNELAFKMWQSVTHRGVSAARSLVMSPFAVTSLLSMIFLGARGPTSGQMNDVLRLDDMMSFNPHQVFRNVTESLVLQKNPGVSTAAIVRELYSDKSRGKMLEFYKQRATQFYDGHVEEVNFETIGDTVRRRTNLLVKRQTSGKISEYMQGSNLVLQSPLAAFSANIFQTDCSAASSEGRDGEMYFTILPATRQRRLVPIPAVVYRSGFMAGYEPSLDATVVSLGGHDSPISTLLVLPGQQGQLAPGDGLPRLEERLLNASYIEGAWSKLLRSLLVRTGLEVQIPRFSHRSQLNITHSLQSMGLNDLFDPNTSDLKGLSGSGNDLHVSDIIQVNTFSTCGEEVIGSRHHMEIYPGTPLRTSREDVSDEQEESREDATPVLRPRQARLDTNHGPSGFEDLVEESIYQMPLALRPRQARIPEGEETHPRLKFDRPFLYFVRHNPTGFILHMGRFNPRLVH